MCRKLKCLVWFLILGVAWAKVTVPAWGKTDLAERTREITLENGLRIFVLERHASPTFSTYYQFGVGGAVDPKGETGIAHLLEHMMFKGTRSLGTLNYRKERVLMRRMTLLWHELHGELDREEDPFQPKNPARIEALRKEIEVIASEQKALIVKNEYDEILRRAGGVAMNASTGYDGTDYRVELPSNRLELWFELERDRLLHPVFREFYSERDVVHEERREGTENDPGGQAWEALHVLMYPAHPYGRPIIGWPGDIERLTVEDAMDYFTTYYSPSNCVMVFVGDVRLDEIERFAKKYFGSWKRQEIPPLRSTDELEQRGERRRVVEFSAQPSLDMGWVTVPEGHEDQYPLDVLSDILGGLSSSRMDRKIVQEERIATSVSTGHPTLKSSGFFVATGEVAPGRTAQELEQAIDREIQRIQEEGVTDSELERAKVRLEVAQIKRLKSNMGLASHIAWAVSATGGLAYLDEYEKRIDAVTQEQVQSAAKKYCTQAKKNVVEVRLVEDSIRVEKTEMSGVRHQDSEGGQARGEAHSRGFERLMDRAEKAKPVAIQIPEIGKDVDRVVLPGGTVVFIKEDHTAPCVEMGLSWLGGSNTTPVEGLAPFELAGKLLTEGGTEALDPMALQERKETLGMEFSMGIGGTQSSAGFWSLSRNFDDSFSLAMDMLMRPRLDAQRMDVIKGQYIDDIRRQYDDPYWGVDRLMTHIIDGDHPRLGYRPSRTDIEAVAPGQVRALWQRYMGKDNLCISVVGDFDKSALLKRLEETFRDWRNAEDKNRVYIERDPAIRPGLFVLEKEVASPAVSMRHPLAIDRTAPARDHAALEILDDILGGSGFRSRLMERLRSDEGLTYGVWSTMLHEGRPRVPGLFGIDYLTHKATVARSVQASLEEVAKVLAELVSENEVREQIDSWENRFVFKFSNDFYCVSRLMAHELDDRPYDRDMGLLKEVRQVTPQDVQRVARQFLRPENLTIGVFGVLTEEDRKALAETREITIVPKEQVFTGGYDETAGEVSQ